MDSTETKIETDKQINRERAQTKQIEKKSVLTFR